MLYWRVFERKLDALLESLWKKTRAMNEDLQIREILKRYEWVQFTTKQQLGLPDVDKLLEAEAKEFVRQNPAYSVDIVKRLLHSKNAGSVIVEEGYLWTILGPVITQVKYWKLRKREKSFSCFKFG